MLLLKCYLPKYPMPPADACVDRLLKEFGGVTTHPFGVGTWRDPATQEVDQEPVRVVECYVPDNAGYLVETILQKYKDEARQKEVLYSLTSTYVIRL